MPYSVIILAAGEGKRTGLGYNKVLLKIHGKPLIDYSVNFFYQDPRCTQIILVINKKDTSILKPLYQNKVDKIIIGGALRQDSVANGLAHVTEDTVLVHDGARPYLVEERIDALLQTLKIAKAASLAMPVYETVKRVHNDVFLETLNRKELMLMQTPQGFATHVLREAYQKKAEKEYTCDITLVNDVLKYEAKVVFGHRNNIKVTTKEDIALLEMMLT